MKNTLLLSILVCFLFIGQSFSTYAQKRMTDSTPKKSYLGVRATLDLTVPRHLTLGDIKIDALSPGPGMSLGIIYNHQIYSGFFVEPGLDLYYNTSSITADYLNNDALINQAFSNRSLRKFGIRVPVSLGYRLDILDNIGFMAYTGPVLDIGFSNDYYVTAGESLSKVHYSGSLYNEGKLITLNRVDCKWRIGVAMTSGNFYIGLSGDIGLCNMVNTSRTDYTKVKLHENIFHLSIGYNFK